MAQEHQLRLKLIGQMAASTPTGVVALPKGRKTRALLAIMAVVLPRPVLREQVTALLWSMRQREQARASLRQSVHELNEMESALGGTWLRCTGQVLQLNMNLVWVDVHAIGGAGPVSTDMLELLPFNLGQDSLVEDLIGVDPAFDQWIAVETQRIRDGAAALAAHLLGQQTEPGPVIIAARQLLALAPAHEGGWRRLIQAYVDQGERAASIQAFEDCAKALQAAGIGSPSDETRQLIGRIRPQGQGGDDAAAAVPGSPRDPGGLKSVWLGVSRFRATDPMDEATLSLGLAEEITTALSRFRWMNLIAPGSLGETPPDGARQPDKWRAQGLDFLLEGSIQRKLRRHGPSGEPIGPIRVTIRLLDLRAGESKPGGEVVWSGRFDRDATDPFALQEEIAGETAAQVDPRLTLHESQRFASRPMGDASAYELLHRAIPALYRLAEASFKEAGALLERAAALAPESATIHAWWAFWYVFQVGQGWSDDPAISMERAGILARQAVALDPSCARALSVAGYVQCFLMHKDIEETIGLHDRALALNPHMPFAFAVSALTLAYGGEHRAAVLRGERARLLSPFDPHSFLFDSVLMVPHLMLGEYETVAELGRRSIGLNPSMSATYKGLLSALGHLGRLAEAAELLEALDRLEPGFNLAAAAARSPLRRNEDLQLYVEGLRMAGLPPG